MKKAIKRAAVAYLIFLVLFTSLLLIPPLFGWNIHSATGNSMSPAMKAGSLVVTVPIEAQDIELGDIIAFRNSEGETVIHRVIDKYYLGNVCYFRTKGDAKDTIDRAISEDSVIGRLKIHIPLIGWLIYFIRLPLGLVFTTIITAALVYVLYKERKTAAQ